MRFVCPFLAALFVLAGFMVKPASAVLAFYKVWESEYLTDHPDKDYAALLKKNPNRCFVCHQGKNRKHRNVYGAQLAELLDAKKDAKDKDKILAAIKQVGDMHFDPKDDKSDTFAARIAASQYPGGELEDLKKEPPKEDAK